MTKNNTNSTQDDKDQKQADQNQNDQDSSKEGDDSGKSQKQTRSDIPRKRFDEVNEKYKAARKRLEELEKAQKEAEAKKLEEEGKLKELLELREKETNDLKTSLEAEKRNNKLKGLQNKALNSLNKEGIIDGDDGLRFIDFDKLLDNDNPDDDLNNMVKSLKEGKSYLFGSGDRKRDDEENRMPGGEGNNQSKTKSKDPFSQAFAKIYT